MTTQATVSAEGGAVIPPAITVPAPGEAAKTAIVPPPVDGDPAATEGEKKVSEGEKEEGGEDKQRQRTDRAHRRIGQLVQQRNDLRDQLAETRAELERLKPKEVNREGLDYDAREDLRIEDALRRRDAENTASLAERLHNQERRTVHDMVIAKVEQAGDETITSALREIPLTEDTVDFLSDQDDPAAIVKHLRDNPEVAKRLFRMTFTGDRRYQGTATRASMREADRILTGIAAGLKSTQQPRAATKAPDPGTTLNGGAPPPGPRDLSEMDAEEYKKTRQAAWKKGEK